MDDATIYAVVNAIKWPVGVLIGVLGYFLRDAHVSMKQDIKKKADKEVLDEAFRVYRDDMNAMEERHQAEMARLERQYDVKFTGVVQQFNDRMNNIEKNLLDRMDLIRSMISKD